MRTVIVAAVARNGVIGSAGALPWRLSEDLARFKRLTDGHALVMGRATFESIGRPLPGRSTVVLTRNPAWAADGVDVVGSLSEALSLCEARSHDAFISGGAAVYREGLLVADSMELTEVDLTPDGDTFFPEVDWSDWTEVARQPMDGFSFVTYERAE